MSKWEMVRLGDIGRIVTGSTPKTSEKLNYASGDLNFFKPSDFNEEIINLLTRSENLISEYARSQSRVLPPQSVLVTCIGIIGKIGITLFESTCNQQVNAIIPDMGVCIPSFIAYAISRKKGEMNRIANAAVVPIINKSRFSDIQISLPPLHIQRRIAEVLDRVSLLITWRKQQLEELDLLIKSRFVEMFGEALDETQAELKDSCKIITDGTHQSPKFTSEGIPFLFVSNIVNGNIDYETEKFISHEEYETLIQRTPIEIGDILLTIVGSYGNPAIVKTDKEFCFQRHIAYLKPKHTLFVSEYLHAALQIGYVKDQIERRVKGIAQKTLNLSELKAIRVNIPPLPLQNAFADFVRQTGKSKVEIKQSLEQLELQYAALMQEYFG